MGDKCQELTNPSNGPLRFASPPVLAAKRPHSHCRTDHTQGKLDTATASTYLAATSSAISDLPRRKKTVLALMSDDVSVLEKLEQRTGVLEKEFDAILLPELAKGIPKAEGMTGGRDINALENGFLGNRYSDVSHLCASYLSSAPDPSPYTVIFQDQGSIGKTFYSRPDIVGSGLGCIRFHRELECWQVRPFTSALEGAKSLNQFDIDLLLFWLGLRKQSKVGSSRVTLECVPLFRLRGMFAEGENSGTRLPTIIKG